jgi:hypothetical protein
MIDSSRIVVWETEQNNTDEVASSMWKLTSYFDAPDEFDSTDEVASFLYERVDPGLYTFAVLDISGTITKREKRADSNMRPEDIEDRVSTFLETQRENEDVFTVRKSRSDSNPPVTSYGFSTRLKPYDYDCIVSLDVDYYTYTSPQDAGNVAHAYSEKHPDWHLIGWNNTNYYKSRGARGESAVEVYLRRKRTTDIIGELWDITSDDERVNGVVDCSSVSAMPIYVDENLKQGEINNESEAVALLTDYNFGDAELKATMEERKDVDIDVLQSVFDTTINLLRENGFKVVQIGFSSIVTSDRHLNSIGTTDEGVCDFAVLFVLPENSDELT